MGTPQNMKQIVLVRMPGSSQLVAAPSPSPMPVPVPVAAEIKLPPPPPAGGGQVTPTRAAAGKAGEPKPPKPPDKPLLPYVRFSRTVYERVKSENPELKLWEIGKIIGQMWRDLPDEDKAEYVDKYKTEKIEYEKNYKAYLVSPGYLAYAAAKAKGESQTTSAPHQKGGEGGGGGGPGGGLGVGGGASSAARQQPERKAFIECVEEEEDADDACFKHLVACARYSRNYRLIEDIFSESVVPSEPPLYTAARIKAYRGHVAALTKYVAKLQNDIRNIEEKFEEKKRKIAQATDAFEREMKRLRK